jgi:ParB-like chromosome segregation protein Spo0J
METETKRPQGIPLPRPPKVELVEMKKIREYEQNPRLHDAANVEKLARSLREYGWTQPILIDGEGVIVAGHGRYLAAKECKFERVPCIRLRNLSPDQLRAYRLADNRLALDAKWDDDLLKLELGEVFDLRATDIDAIGFTQTELDRILKAANAPGAGSGDGSGGPEFKQTDENVETQYECPSCHYQWSGTPKRK